MNFLCQAGAFMGLQSRHCRMEQVRDQLLQEKFVNHIEQEGLLIGTREEFDFRFQIFAEKDAYIQKVNEEQSSFTLGHNMFSTLTYEEGQKRLGYKGTKNVELKAPKLLDDTNLSASVDWRTQGAVNAVKNQGQCGSCWAFSATCAIEFAHWFQTQKLLSLSEQQVVSCDNLCYGCQGGWQYKGFEYVMQNGQELETDYSYTSGQSQATGSCFYNKAKAATHISTYENVTPNSVSQLKAAIDKSVVSVTIEADKSVFQQYHSGIFDSTACGTRLDHAVAAVGYGSENGQDYYIVRNSWSASWGDQGYIKIAAVEGKGICGIQMQNSYPVA